MDEQKKEALKPVSWICKCGHEPKLHDDVNGCHFTETVSTEDSWDCSCTKYVPLPAVPTQAPKKPGLWSKLGNAVGEAIGTWFAGRQ